MVNVQYDAAALLGGVAGWLSGKWKVGIHDLFDIFILLLVEGGMFSAAEITS